MGRATATVEPKRSCGENGFDFVSENGSDLSVLQLIVAAVEGLTCLRYLPQVSSERILQEFIWGATTLRRQVVQPLLNVGIEVNFHGHHRREIGPTRQVPPSAFAWHKPSLIP